MKREFLLGDLRCTDMGVGDGIRHCPPQSPSCVLHLAEQLTFKTALMYFSTLCFWFDLSIGELAGGPAVGE